MKIKLDINEKEYTLYYTRDVIVRMEKEGLDATKMDSLHKGSRIIHGANNQHITKHVQ